MANFFKGLLRANSTIYGDLEGDVTNLKKGRLTISIEKGKCIAWVVGQDDLELSRDNVKKLTPLSTDVVIRDLPSNNGKLIKCNIYRIEMKDGKTGTLRLPVGTEYKVLELIK